jgi:hypothetical protein
MILSSGEINGTAARRQQCRDRLESTAEYYTLKREWKSIGFIVSNQTLIFFKGAR